MDADRLSITPKRPKGDDGYKVFSIWIKEDIVKRLDTISAETGRSRNELIGLFLEYAADHCKIENK